MRAIANVRLLVYAGLMPTDHVTGRDSDAGKLPAWRARAAGKREPRIYLREIVARNLRDDLFDAIRCEIRYGRKRRFSFVSLGLLTDEYGFDAPDGEMAGCWKLAPTRPPKQIPGDIDGMVA